MTDHNLNSNNGHLLIRRARHACIYPSPYCSPPLPPPAFRFGAANPINLMSVCLSVCLFAQIGKSCFWAMIPNGLRSNDVWFSCIWFDLSLSLSFSHMQQRQTDSHEVRNYEEPGSIVAILLYRYMRIWEFRLYFRIVGRLIFFVKAPSFEAREAHRY